MNKESENENYNYILKDCNDIFKDTMKNGKKQKMNSFIPQIL